MVGALLRRLGLWLLVVAAAAAAAPLVFNQLPAALTRPGLALNLGALAIVLLGLGFLFEWLPHGRCKLCKRRAEHGSSLCHQHHRELEQQGARARERQLRQHRDF